MSSLERIHRLLHVVEILQSGRALNSRQLADECGVSRRTLFRDLKTLQLSGLRIIFDEQRQGYVLPGMTYLQSTDFTVQECLSLLSVCQELGDVERGIPFQQAARTAAVKLLSSLPQNMREYVGELTELVSIRLDTRSDMSGSQPIYQLLMESLGAHRHVRVTYRSFGDEGEISTMLSPYRVLFQKHSWYVIGRSSLHRAVRTFNLARITNAELLESKYEIPKRFSLDNYLGNAWSMIPERGNTYHVVLRFEAKVARNVAEVQWHKTQQLIWNDDGSLNFEVTVDGLREIVWWILGYGDQVEVLKPAVLRREIARQVSSLCQTYQREIPDTPEGAEASTDNRDPASPDGAAAAPDTDRPTGSTRRRKAPQKKSSARKPAAKKSATKKSAAKKRSARSSASKTPAVRKAVTKKATAKKTTAHNATARKKKTSRRKTSRSQA